MAQIDQPLTTAPIPPTRPNPALLVFLIFPIAGLIIALALSSTRGNENLSSGLPLPPAVAYSPRTLVGKTAPDFRLITPDNRPVALRDLRGEIVFLNFWAIYCAPCKVEMPAFQQLLDGKIPGRATVLAVNQGDSPDAIIQYFKDLGVNIPTVLDRTIAVGDSYQLVNLPHTFVIDAQGIIRYDHIGIMTEAYLAQYIQKLSDSAFF